MLVYVDTHTRMSFFILIQMTTVMSPLLKPQMNKIAVFQGMDKTLYFFNDDIDKYFKYFFLFDICKT